jgi:hypothetical protein
MGGAVTSTYLGGWIVGATDGYDIAFWIYATGAVVTGFALVPLVARSRRLQDLAGAQPGAPAGA